MRFNGDSRFSVFLGSKSKFLLALKEFSNCLSIYPRRNLLLEPGKP